MIIIIRIDILKTLSMESTNHRSWLILRVGALATFLIGKTCSINVSSDFPTGPQSLRYQKRLDMDMAF